MGLFKPIWESRNVSKIYKFIRKSKDDHEKAEIFLKCNNSDVKYAAAQSIRNLQILVDALIKAVEGGDYDTVRRVCSLKRCKSDEEQFTDIIINSGNKYLISLCALKTSSLEEWRVEYDPLLEIAEYENVSSLYRELNRIHKEKLKKQAEEEERQKKEIFLRYPEKNLRESVGSEEEAALWKLWYEHELDLEPKYDQIYVTLLRMDDISWEPFFPSGKLFRIVVGNGLGYAGEGCFHAEKAETDISKFLSRLYKNREDLRDEIMSLNNIVYFKGEDSHTVNFGDHHEAWYVTFDAIPPYKMYISVKDLNVTVHFERM